MTIMLITFLLMNSRKWKQKKQLQWQQVLAGYGIGFRTQIMQVLEDVRPFNGYKKIRIIAMIRINGKNVCWKMQTWIKPGEEPKKGEKVVIRYLPSTHHVLVKHLSS